MLEVPTLMTGSCAQATQHMWEARLASRTFCPASAGLHVQLLVKEKLSRQSTMVSMPPVCWLAK